MSASCRSDGDRAAESVAGDSMNETGGGNGGNTAQSAPTSDTVRRELGGRLASQAGDVVSVEVDRALRAFDDGDGVPPEARRVLSTMAVRIAVGVVRPPAVAADDRQDAETVAELFLADD